MREIEQASELPAAQKLLEYIRTNFEKGGVPRFCEQHGLDRLKVQRAIQTLKRIDVDFAFAIEEATDGAVKASDWRSPEPESPVGEATEAEPADPTDEAPASTPHPSDAPSTAEKSA